MRVFFWAVLLCHLLLNLCVCAFLCVLKYLVDKEFIFFVLINCQEQAFPKFGNDLHNNVHIPLQLQQNAPFPCYYFVHLQLQRQLIMSEFGIKQYSWQDLSIKLRIFYGFHMVYSQKYFTKSFIFYLEYFQIFIIYLIFLFRRLQVKQLHQLEVCDFA